MGKGILWCPHCSFPHALGTKICPTTAKTLEREVHEPSPRDRYHPLLGTVVGGKYRIERLIGRGGMSEVFEAENTVLRRSVAVKVARGAAFASPAVRLRREAQLVAAVHHPNICDVYDIGVLPDGAPFVVLERLSGETFDSYLKTGSPMSIAAVGDTFSQILSGLQAAHGARIVHRDLKPKNVFFVDRLGCTPLVKLLDFGFAKDLKDPRGRPITLPGTAVGTVPYMAPEQLVGEPASERSDLFAVAIMMYEALTGRHPFVASTLAELKTNLFRCQPRPARELRRDLPDAIAKLLSRALARDAAERWATALDFQRAINDAFAPRWNESTPPSPKPDSLPPSSAMVRPLASVRGFDLAALSAGKDHPRFRR